MGHIDKMHKTILQVMDTSDSEADLVARLDDIGIEVKRLYYYGPIKTVCEVDGDLLVKVSENFGAVIM